MKWICCQIGAREHYAIPRALFRFGALEYFLTDTWVPPSSILRIIGDQRSGIGDRWHEELKDARVTSFNWSLLAFETLARARGLGMWPSILARNRWFQRKVVKALTSEIGPLISAPQVLLSYSYTALKPFRYAKARGWKTVLAQIDPGPEEEAIVAEEASRVPELAGDWQPAPSEYWNDWREECKIADRIIVNSEWSRDALIRAGVAPGKLSIIPLAYDTAKEGNQKSAAFAEATARQGNQKSEIRNQKLHPSYPARFTHERPLRVLFLGLINLRKGVARLLEAARMLCNEPVEFWMVGPVEIADASTITAGARVKWFGPVTRKQASHYYKEADVFILPTLSDGFAITQLEAQAHGLSVITSENCGKVVQNGLNGIVLDEPSAACIAAALRECITCPDRLQEFAFASHLRNKFTIRALADNLLDLDGTL